MVPKSQRELLAALREANAKLQEERQVFLSGPVVVFKWRNEPGWPVEYASPNVEQVFGYTAQEFLEGRVAYADLIPPEDLQRVAEEVRVASSGNRPAFRHAPYRVRHRAGHVVWLDDFTTIQRGSDGTPISFFGYVIDTTERHDVDEERQRLKAQMLHAQKLESLGLLAGGIAHDFNNLLTGILGNVALAEAAASPAESAGFMQRIRGASERAAELCRQLLAYSGRGAFKVGPCDLNALVEDMGQLLSVAVPKHVELRFQLAAPLPSIEADATQIRQLLLNLITNASEAIGERAGAVDVETFERGSRVCVSVRDNGCGMGAETLERIFDPFFSTKFEGRGLGLAAVRGILNGHGGTIDVESAEGRGTQILVTFPSSDKVPLPPQPALVYDASWRASGGALVVDDEEIVQVLAAHVLESIGFVVWTAGDGIEGLEQYKKHRETISLVLLDLTMPRMGGADLYFELMRMRPDLPIILMSGYDKSEVTPKLRNRTPFWLLTKPFQPQQLVALVRCAIERQGQASA
jgi:PAS domain S-box-containing protein